MCYKKTSHAYVLMCFKIRIWFVMCCTDRIMWIRLTCLLSNVFTFVKKMQGDREIVPTVWKAYRRKKFKGMTSEEQIGGEMVEGGQVFGKFQVYHVKKRTLRAKLVAT